ncbi:MAG: ribosome biogenesis GTPase Der [Patescibacteria group bacterium]|nr:ribosome biogenesis GTPase Der [Patescibacteria group bacterium]
MPPLLAIVGRPNVGKSTLFNRLIGKRLAIIAKEAGTTRDRIYQDFDLNGLEATLVDTGGLEYGKQENIESDIQSQAKIAIKEADLIIFVIDSMQELTVDDFQAADILRRAKKPVLLAANKCDREVDYEHFNIYELGFGEPIKVSAIHKLGIDELKNEAMASLEKAGFKESEKKSSLTEKHNTINLCFLGRPNVGKSSLVNKLLGEDKVIVSDKGGTTRDATDTKVEVDEKTYNLIDTAGIRRRGKIGKGVEYFSVLRGFSAIERSDIVALIIDGEEGVNKQDAHIASYILEADKGLMLVVNKWDLKEKGDEEQRKFLRSLQQKLPFLPWAPVIFVSAKTGRNATQIFKLAQEIFKERQRQIDNEEIQTYIEKITLKHLPTGTNNKRPKIMDIKQTNINPPTFKVKASNAGYIHFSYKRYLENKIREKYGFLGTPIKLIF